MFPRKNCSAPKVVLLVELPKSIVICRPVVKNIVDDTGLIRSVVTHQESDHFDDEQTNYRAFNVQTLLNVDAIDLLRPVGSIPQSRLTAVDALGSVQISMENLQSKLDELKNFINVDQKSTETLKDDSK